MLMALIAPLAMHAQTLLVHDGTETNRYVPFYGYYADADQQNQMIYPATELTAMNGMSITQMVFYYSSVGSYGNGVGTWTISLGETTATTLDGLDEATVLTEVFTGGLDALFNTTDQTLTIAFDNEYTYHGGNLLVEFSHSAGSYKDYYFYGEEVEEASYNGYMEAVYDFLPKTTFSYQTPALCPKPTGLALATDGENVTATWEGTAASYNIDVDGSVTTGVTSPYTFRAELSTTYVVKVQADCGTNGTSEWTNPVSITTPDCVGGHVIEYTLTDSYGDGWNGNAIHITDGCNTIASLTIANGSSLSGSITLCGDYYEFVWVVGSYAYEASWTITDNGAAASSGNGSGLSDGELLYTIGDFAYEMPTELNAEVTTTTATLTWTDAVAEAWQICFNEDETNLIDVTRTNYTMEGLTPDTEYTFKVRAVGADGTSPWACPYTFTTEAACPAPTDLTVSDITATSASVSWTGEASSYTLRYREMGEEDYATITFAPNDVWQDGTGYQLLLDADATAYGTIIPETGGLTSGGDASAAVYAEFEYKIPASADGAMNTQNVLIGESVTIRVPAGTFDWCVTNPTPGDRIWIAGEGRADDYVFEGGKTYLFVVQSNGNGGDEVVVTVSETGSAKADEWTTINDVTSPTTITVEPETDYIVEVQANCGEYLSSWVRKNFSTPSNCQVPTPLDVTEVTAYTATLNWSGLQDSYEVQYRSKGSRELLFFESFDGQPSTWTLTNAAYDRTSSATTDYFVYLGYNTTETAYLITPDLTDIVSVGTVEFYHRCYNGDATFQVGFSSTTNDVDAFTWGDEISAAGVFFTAYDVAMPAGTKYVAVKSTTSAATNYVFINDFGIYGNEIPAGQWNTATVNATTYPISGLTANTEYEWQVRGVCTEGYSDWCELVTFTTEPTCPVPTELDVDDVTSNSAVITWVSDAASFDIMINNIVTEGVTSPYELEALTANTEYTVKVRANCGEGDYSDWTSAITFWTECGVFTIPYEYGFDDVLTSDSPEVNCWSYGNLTSGNPNTVGLVYRDQETGDIAFRFNSISTSTDGYDQILISPELVTESDIIVEFEYKAQNASYPETFKVGYSLDGESYTWFDEFTASNTDEYLTYTSEVMPAGTKYVAVYYLSEYAYYLYLDNFSFTAAPAIGQTLQLSEGWNWVSTYIDMNAVDGMAMLQEGLGDHATQIVTFDDSAEYFDGVWYWGSGEENKQLTNSEMIMVEVAEDCTVTLEGPVVGEVEITINPEWNWIGYPIDTELDFTEAMSDFDAEDEDSFNGFGATNDYFEGWYNTFNTLVPGQGYMYYSNGDEPKTLVYHRVGTKAGRIAKFVVQRKDVKLAVSTSDDVNGWAKEFKKIAKQEQQQTNKQINK